MAVRKKKAAKSRKGKAVAQVKKSNAKARPTVKKAKTSGRGQSIATRPISTHFPSSPITSKQSKAQVFAEIASMTGLAKGEVKTMFSALRNIAERHLKGKGYGEFVIPELAVKIRRIHKPATKARMGRNPFTGEEIQIAAKPARKSVKATALKALKELAAS